jgi:hypothetical protein
MESSLLSNNIDYITTWSKLRPSVNALPVRDSERPGFELPVSHFPLNALFLAFFIRRVHQLGVLTFLGLNGRR